MTQVSPEPLVEELARDIVGTYKSHLQQKIHAPTKRDVMWLSDIHECARFNAYACLEGDKRKPVDERLQATFDAGIEWEAWTIRKLIEMHYDVYRNTDAVSIKSRDGKVMARGRIDLFIRYKSELFPCEIKSLDSNSYNRIQSVEDLYKTPWTEKYIKQLMMYLYGKDKEQGLFIINDRAAHLKIMPLYLDYGYCEKTLKMIEYVFRQVQKEELPDRIPYSNKLCGPCQFNHICLPTQVIEGGDTLDDPEIESLLKRHEELRPVVDEYEEVHKTVIGLFQEKPQTTVGGKYIVVPQKRTRTSYDFRALSEKVRREIEKQTDFWVVNIKSIEPINAKDKRN